MCSCGVYEPCLWNRASLCYTLCKCRTGTLPLPQRGFRLRFHYLLVPEYSIWLKTHWRDFSETCKVLEITHLLIYPFCFSAYIMFFHCVIFVWLCYFDYGSDWFQGGRGCHFDLLSCGPSSHDCSLLFPYPSWNVGLLWNGEKKSVAPCLGTFHNL